MKQVNEEVFEHGKVSKAVWSLALPTIIGMLVMAFYNIVDTYFIGQTNDPIQVAAVSLSMPLFMILMACGNLFGVGASSQISRNLGAKKYDEIKKVSSIAFYGAITVGVVLAGVALWQMSNLASFLGANALNQPYVEGYLNLIMIGAPFIVTSAAMSHIIRSEGNAKLAMVGMLLSTLVNISLDPIFIFVMDFGVIGAALATVVANIVSFVFYIVVIVKAKNSRLGLNVVDVKKGGGILGAILAIGTPASVTSLLTSASTIMYNLFLAPYGDGAVGAMGIVMKISLIYTMIFMGMSMGVQPLLGYCYGSEKFARFKEVLGYACKVSVVIGVVFLVILYPLSSFIVGLFIDDAEILYYGTQMLRVQVLTAPTMGILYISMATMQATGKSVVAMILSLSRQGIAFIPTILILDRLYGFNGLIWAQPIADAISLVVAGVIFMLFFKKLNQEHGLKSV